MSAPSHEPNAGADSGAQAGADSEVAAYAPADLLAIAPHPDDVEIFCGGIIAKSVAQGHNVAILDLTRGELSSRGTPELRAVEAAQAADLLGAQRYNLGLPDGGIREGDAQTSALAAVLRQIRPKVVLAPWKQARHPDHSAASQLIDRAVFFARLARASIPGEPHHVGRVVYYLQRVVPRADFLVDVSDVWSLKRDAIAAHGSQTAPKADGPRTLVGAPDALTAIEARDRYWGAQLGVTYAEAFCTAAAVPVDDLVAHFGNRDEPHFSIDRS